MLKDKVITNDKKLHILNMWIYVSCSLQSEYTQNVNTEDNKTAITINIGIIFIRQAVIELLFLEFREHF